MVAVKTNPDKITVTVIPPGDTPDDAVRTGIVNFEGNVDVVVIIQKQEFSFLCSSCSVVRLDLGETTLPFTGLPRSIVD